MATLDEISKERQRVSEALARVDAQREKLVGQLGLRKIAIVLAALGLATMLSAAVLPAQAQAHDWGYGWRGHERYEHEWRGHRWHPGYYSYRYYGPSTYLAAPGPTFGFAFR